MSTRPYRYEASLRGAATYDASRGLKKIEKSASLPVQRLISKPNHYPFRFPVIKRRELHLSTLLLLVSLIYADGLGPNVSRFDLVSQLCQSFVEALRGSNRASGVSITNSDESVQVRVASCIRDSFVTWWVVQRAGLYPRRDRVFFPSW